MEGIPSMPREQPLRKDAPGFEKLTIEDVDDAREHVAELVAQGVHPLVTVPEEFAEQVLKDGIHVLPKQDGLTGKKFSFIAGTIGVPPLAPSLETRYVLAVDGSRVKIEPRMTGEDRAFHGVVQFPDGIPADAFTVVGTCHGSTFIAAEGIEQTKTPLH
jgi:hypothetical protein